MVAKFIGQSFAPRRRALLQGGCLLLLPFLSNCSVLEREDSIRYRITLYIETPQGLVSGSSVWEARLRDAWLSSPYGTVRWGYSGEAVAIDLPGGTLFALMETPYSGELPFKIMQSRLGSEYREQPDWHETWKLAWPRWKREKLHFELPEDDYPLLVRFRDARDPSTVESVDPYDLAASFGRGVTLKRITIQITDDPITTGIWRRFPWWQNYRERNLDGSDSSVTDMVTKDISARLSWGSFSTEFRKMHPDKS
tara:strand:- start:269 stop:1027 length:759 start_codon:yes stop_codon:yes gene_type:complete